VRGGGHHGERSALAEQLASDVQSFGSVSPQVDEHLALQPLGLDDPPDFERGALAGAHG
jgi:hypothetical protein